ncbi:MAG: O-antigen ligase family protein [Candidatus Cloacimonetes bacterium]|nr:O-antigen ligase family protein [Candidatus Cloacimonadota bacterium]
MFRFSAGVILLSDYYFVILFFLILSKINEIKIDLIYNRIFYIFGFITLVSLFSSIIFGFDVNVFVKIIRYFTYYIAYIYLALYLYESRENTIRFIRVIFILVIVAFILQIYEMTLQKRVVIDFISNPNNIYYTGGRYINIPYFGWVLYNWNRMLAFIPLAMFFSFYFLLKNVRVIPVSNTIMILICLLSVYLGLSRTGIFIYTLTLIFFIILNLRTGSTRKFAFLGVTAVFVMIIYFYYFQVTAFEAFSLRLQTMEQMQTGEESSASGRVIFWQDQIENAFESPLIGRGFNLRSFSTFTGDVGMSNLITLFGISGLLIPFFIFYTSVKYVNRISVKDMGFQNAFLSVFLAYFLGSMITADVYLSGSIIIVTLITIVTVKANDVSWPLEEEEEEEKIEGEVVDENIKKIN